MYQFKEPKFHNITGIETDDNNRLTGAGNRLIKLNYRPTDPDYQNAAISYIRNVGMSTANNIRERMDQLSSADLGVFKDCYHFAMSGLRTQQMLSPENKALCDLAAIRDYGIGYITSLYMDTGRKPLDLLDEHLQAINACYEEKHGTKPDNVKEFNEAVVDYYKEELNFGRQPWEIQAKMDAMKQESNRGQETDLSFEDAVASLHGDGPAQEM